MTPMPDTLSQSKPFCVFLLKPSHYDDDGYPITWGRTLIPSNSLAVLYALCDDFRKRNHLGKNTDVHITIIDETNTRISPKRIAKQVAAHNAVGFAAMVGVQTNQFPRTMDLATELIRHGVHVCVGGFHVAGYLAVMKALPQEVVAAQRQGVSFFAGEGESGRVARVLTDAYHGRLAPLYDYLGERPMIAGEPTPFLPSSEVSRTQGDYTAFDLGRGCPFKCSFCTIINVHGHESRFRTPDDLERIIRANHAIGVHRFFLTDDNIARNKNWEAFFDRLASLRAQKIRIRILAQVDAASYKIPGFIKKAAAAGVDQIFIGMESINPENLKAINKKQNRVSTYQQAMRAWKQYPIVITAAYIVGLPGDTPEAVRDAIETIKRELWVDTIYFTNLTPLPGSEDHRRLADAGEWMDDDLNKYDTHHCVSRHPRMSQAQWSRANKDAWRCFYTSAHMDTILRRMVAGKSDKKLTTINRLAVYSYFGCHSAIHPIDGGLLRKKYRRDRRPGLPVASPLSFYPRYAMEVLEATTRVLASYVRLRWRYWQISRDPASLAYTDEAMGAVSPLDD